MYFGQCVDNEGRRARSRCYCVHSSSTQRLNTPPTAGIRDTLIKYRGWRARRFCRSAAAAMTQLRYVKLAAVVAVTLPSPPPHGIRFYFIIMYMLFFFFFIVYYTYTYIIYVCIVSMCVCVCYNNNIIAKKKKKTAGGCILYYTRTL